MGHDLQLRGWGFGCREQGSTLKRRPRIFVSCFCWLVGSLNIVSGWQVDVHPPGIFVGSFLGVWQSTMFGDYVDGLFCMKHYIFQRTTNFWKRNPRFMVIRRTGPSVWHVVTLPCLRSSGATGLAVQELPLDCSEAALRLGSQLYDPEVGRWSVVCTTRS